MGGDEEKRKYPRQQTEDLFVHYRLVKSAFVDAAQNLSEGGIFIAAENPLPLHSEVEVILTDGRPEPFILAGKVVRVVWKTQGTASESCTGMAVEFKKDMSADLRQRLQLLIRNSGGSPGAQ